MKLHTSLTSREVHDALDEAKADGKVTRDVEFVEYDQGGSYTHERRFDIQLGTWNKHSLPADYRDQHGKRLAVRRYKNTGTTGASSGVFGGDQVWAATYDEWGWFIAEVMYRDPKAVFGSYKGVEGFNERTKGKFVLQLRKGRVAQLHLKAAEAVARYLPANYRVTGEDAEWVYFAGRDRAGWTLEDYVLPRLASGLYFAEEVKS